MGSLASEGVQRGLCSEAGDVLPIYPLGSALRMMHVLCVILDSSRTNRGKLFVSFVRKNLILRALLPDIGLQRILADVNRVQLANTWKTLIHPQTSAQIVLQVNIPEKVL